MYRFKNLLSAIDQLNSSTTIDDHVYKSLFNFTIEERDGRIEIYDANEQYYCDYEEDYNCEMASFAEEFGLKFEYVSDPIMKVLEEALKKDVKDAYFEWENNLVLVIVAKGGAGMRVIYVVRTVDLLNVRYGDRIFQTKDDAFQILKELEPSETYVDIIFEVEIEDDVKDEEWSEFYHSYKAITRE